MTDGPHHQKEGILKCWKSFFLASSNQSCKRKRFYLVPCCTFADNLTLWFGLIILSNTFFLLLCICIKCLDFCWFIFKTFERYISTLKTPWKHSVFWERKRYKRQIHLHRHSVMKNPNQKWIKTILILQWR